MGYSAYLKRHIGLIILDAHDKVGLFDSITRHRCGEYNLMFAGKRLADPYNIFLKIMTSLGGHSFVLDIVQKNKTGIEKVTV